MSDGGEPTISPQQASEKVSNRSLIVKRMKHCVLLVLSAGGPIGGVFIK